MDMSAILYQVQGLLIFLVLFVIFILSWIIISRHRNQKKFERDKNGDKIWVHYWTPAGKYYNIICNVDNFRVQPPEGHELTEYFIENDCVYEGWYPSERGGFLNKFTRISVPTTSYIANRREPIVSTDPKRWIENKDKVQITATMERVAVNESFAKTAAAMQSAAWKDLMGMVQFGKYAKYNLYIGLVLAVMGLIGIVLSYSTNANVTNFMAAWFGGK